MFLIYTVIYHACGMLITLVIIRFTVSRSAVSIDTSSRSPNLQSYSLFLFFLFSIIHNKFLICDIPESVIWHLLLSNKKYCVGALHSSWHAMSQSSHFISSQLTPYRPIFWLCHQMLVLHELSSAPLHNCTCKLTQQLEEIFST